MSFLLSGHRSLRLRWGERLAFALLFLLTAGGTSFAQVPRCQCQFANPPWEAYGTKAACSVYMHRGRKSCEISFAGLGASNELISEILGEKPSDYDSQVYELLIRYVTYLSHEDMKALTKPDFLARFLPIFARGAYLRGSPAAIRASGAKQLDSILMNFFKDRSKEISDVFLGNASPFSTDLSGAKIFVGKGYVTVDYKEADLTMAYLP